METYREKRENIQNFSAENFSGMAVLNLFKIFLLNYFILKSFTEKFFLPEVDEIFLKGVNAENNFEIFYSKILRGKTH
jgi:hypothetical protein